MEQALINALPLGPQTPAGGITLPEAFTVRSGEGSCLFGKHSHVAGYATGIRAKGRAGTAGKALGHQREASHCQGPPQ